MAKLNKERIIRAAEKYIRSGKPDAAVKEYEKWIAANPNDRNIVHKAADLYARIGEIEEAIKKYEQLAKNYGADGFNVKAIATHKMVLRLVPQNLRAMESLAALQEEEGLFTEAKSNYQTLVELYSKSEQKGRVADVFRRLAKLDPTDLRIRYRFAEFLDREGQVAQAVAEYIGIADECINMGLVAEAMKIMEKGLHADVFNRPLRLKLAQASVLQGDYAKAIQLLNEIREKYPDDTEIMTRLGEAYIGAGQLDEAEKVIGHLAKLEPDNPEHAGRMSDLAIGRGDFDKALERLCPVVDGYVAQGDGEKAGSLLQKILNKEPHHIATLVKLAEVHTVVGNEHGRLSAYDRLCEAYAQRGNYEKAVDVAQQLVGLEPESSQHRDRLRFLKSRLGGLNKDVHDASDDVEIPGIDLEGDDAAVDSEPIPELSPEDEEHIKDKVIEVEVYVRYGLAGKAIDQLKNVLQSYRFHTDVREKLIEIYRGEGMRREAAEELTVLSRVYQRLGNEEKALELLEEAEGLDVTESEDDSVEELPPEIPDVPVEDEELQEDDSEIDWDTPTEESQALDELTDEDEALSEPNLDSEVAEGSAPLTPALQEVDEYVAMGLYEDARESLSELLRENPENPELFSKIEELGFSVSQLQEGCGVDEPGEPPNIPGLDAIFREFKKGVERQLGTEDYDTRYNLGIAYKEMGLIDDAIAEFQLAAKDEALLLECCSLLGLCFMEKDMHRIAIKWFEKGLALPGRSEEEYLGLRYDLARAYETVGDNERALDLYEDIYRVHARFRDVSKRVRKLQAVKS